jgi:hypothetical protein
MLGVIAFSTEACAQETNHVKLVGSATVLEGTSHVAKMGQKTTSAKNSLAMALCTLCSCKTLKGLLNEKKQGLWDYPLKSHV